MITVCPTCALTLAVTAADLRVGQGQVRCGRCAAVFNALAALQDDQSEIIEPARPDDPAPTDVTAQPPATATAQELSPAEPANSVSFEDTLRAVDGADTAGETVVSAASLRDSANDDDAHTPRSANDDTIDPVAANDELLPPSYQTAAAVANETLDIAVESVVVHDDYPGLDLDLTPAAAAAVAAAPPAARNYWVAGGLSLLALLGIQAVHYNRNALAARDSWRSPLQALYGRIGVELQPAWQPAALVVQRHGEMMADEQGAMTLRASVQNSAANSQPLPLLRVVLLDRFGARIAARDLQPQEYLPARVAAEIRIDAEVALADPGPAAAGFELDACLRVAAGRLQCANHTAVRR
jgi:predicted Zn finger-like uncharacterized protein